MNNKHLFDEKQRFSLRKLTVGLASVLVGLTLFGTAQTANSQTVHAATITHEKNGDDVIDEEPALDKDGNPKHDTIVDVGYDAQDQDQTIHYVDKNGQPAKDKDGNPVPDGHVTGKTDDMNKDVPMPNGWKPKDPDTDGKTDLSNPDPITGKVPDKNVTIEHGQHTTAPGETHKKGDPIVKDAPGSTDTATQTGPENKYQEDIKKEDVTKDLTRTITVNKPTGDVTVDAQGHQNVSSQAEDHSETVGYNRTTTVDDVTGHVVSHGDWQLADPAKNTFGKFTVPTVDGYTPNPVTIDATPAPTDQDSINGYTDPKIVVDYTANTQHVNYVFKDGNNTVKTGTVSGVTDQTVDSKAKLADVITQLTKQGYDMSHVTIKPYKFTADNGDITIDLSKLHGSKDVKPGDTIPDGITDPNKSGSDKRVTDSDVTETVTRHITFHDPTHENSTSTQDRNADQTVTLKRSFTYDDVTKQVTSWGKWSTADVQAVNVPKVDGYTVTVTGATLQDGKIPADTLTDGYKDPKIVVDYTANTQHVNYVFKDGNNTVKTGTVSGVTDQTVDSKAKLADVITQLTKQGYDMSHVTIKPYKFTADNGDITIDLSKLHGSKDVKPGDTIPDGITDPNKSGSDKRVTDSDVTETVTRHITFHDPTHENSTSTQDRNADQTVTLKRSFTYDDVTKQVTSWGKWSTADVQAVNVPKVDGYTVTVTGATLQDGKIPADTLTDGYKDPKIVVDYTANTQHVNYVFKDGNNTVKTGTVSGVTDQTVDSKAKLADVITQLTKQGYDMSHVTIKPYKFTADNGDITIDLSKLHGSKDVKPGDTIPDGITDPNKSGSDKRVTDSDVTETVTRHITFHDPTHENSTSTQDRNADQTVTLKRSFTYDDVTKQVTSWGKWSTADVQAVNVPKVDGYTVTVTGATLQDGKIPADTLTDGYKDPKIVVDYTANTQHVNYVFKDGNNTVKTGTVSGVTDQTVDSKAKLADVITQLTKQGYDMSHVTIKPYKFTADNGDITIDLSKLHGSKDVKPGDTIPDGITDPNKSGSDKRVTDSDVTETVTRHITFHDPTHENSTSTQDRNADQTVTLKRSFTYDDVTKQVTSWGKWSTADVQAVNVPKVDGYTVTVTGATLQDGKIPADTLTDGYKDPKIEVTYTAQYSTQTIHYVDENGHELSATDNKDQNGNVIENSTVTAKTDDVGNVQVPKGWKLVNDHDDKTTKVAYGSDGKIPVKNVKITHATIEVTPDKPHKQGEPIDPKVPTGSKYGAGLTSDDLNDVAYREIHFKLPASTNAEDYAKRLKDTGLSSAKVEGTNSVVVRQEVAYKRTAIVDAITGEVKGYNPAGVMNKGWVPSAENLVDAVIKNGSAVFNKVLIPQIAGYKAHTGNAKVTIMKLANGSHAALSQLFVSFMAIPAPKDGNSTGAVNKEQVKPDDTKPGDTKPDTTPVKDLTKSDQKKIADDTQPGKGDETKPGKGDETKPGKSDETKPGKGDETKPAANPDAGKGNQDHKTGETKPQANPDAGKGNQDHKKGNQDHKTAETKPQANPDAGKKAHVSPIVGHDSGANKKNSKITNTAASASDKSNRNTPIGSANDEANKTNRTVQAAVVNSDKKVLPQTGASQNKIGIIGMVFASLAGMLGLAGTKKKRKND